MTFVRTGAVALGTVLATVVFGWWCVPVVGIGSGWLSRSRRAAAAEAAAGAALGWAAILAGSAVSGPVWAVAERVGPVFGVPALGFVVITLVFPALLAGSAALVAGGLRRRELMEAPLTPGGT